MDVVDEKMDNTEGEKENIITDEPDSDSGIPVDGKFVIQKPLPYTLPIEHKNSRVTARGELLSYGNENPFRVGFYISENSVVLGR